MQCGWLCAALFICLAGVRGESVRVKPERLHQWVRSSLQHLKHSLSRRFTHLHPGRLAVYVSESSSEAHKVLLLLPDSRSKQITGHAERNRDLSPDPSAHDAVLVLDPNPGENFGHPVVLFHVDFNTTKKKCEHHGGFVAGDDCLTRVLKSRCQNQLKRHQSHSEVFGEKGHGLDRTETRGVWIERNGAHCEIDFLPLVFGEGDINRTQRLHCVEHSDFAHCPRHLLFSTQSSLASGCELKKNTRRCHQQPLATHLSCRLYQTCDHAVLVSGGWQQLITYQRHVKNLRLFYQMLRNNGFYKGHVKIFFAGSGQILGDRTVEVYPAMEKAVIRNHISYLCRRQHCADSLVLYLNSPTLSDGTMLLRDSNSNGIADQKERYQVDELLADLAGCRAGRVLLFVEQRYGGSLTKRLKRSTKHHNVVLLYGTPWAETADFWASLHPSQCLLDHMNQATSTPSSVRTAGLLNVTLAGAPCNATPALTEAELQKEYMGCQNLPTALWYHGWLHPSKVKN